MTNEMEIKALTENMQTVLDFVDGFLEEMSDFAPFNAVYEKYFTGKPARSCVAVKQLPRNVLCEVEVVAYLK